MSETAVEDLLITPLAVPESLDGPQGDELRALADLDNLVCLSDSGRDHLHSDAAEELPSWQDQTDDIRIGFLARRAGELVGAVTMSMSNQEGMSTVEFDLYPHPDHWHEGVEDALLDALERVAREHGRQIAQTWTLHRAGSGDELLPSPTGFGGIPRHDRQTEFFLRRGFTFEQCERNSVFDLRGDLGDVERMLARAVEAAGGDYRVVTWSSPTPEEYADGFAYVLSRMDTDMPNAAMVYEEQVWDAARVARRDDRLLRGGHTVSVAAVQHVPTGAIVAFNELVIGADLDGATHQYGTLVVKEHRGRRLGMIVKCANLLRWRGLVPSSPRISTFNAEENRHMLDINEAMGFIPASYAGAWKKVFEV